MIKYDSGKKYPSGLPIMGSTDENIAKVLDQAKRRNKRSWDYIAIIAGNCGAGKSTLARGLANYCDRNFDEWKIAFDAEQFIEITTRAPQYSAVILDESFADFNSRAGSSKSFLKVINHIQLIRQKNLFVFLCLPNFFDLSKTIAIFRTNHLFVAYANQDGVRGSYAVFDRIKKKNLYILGQKFLNYHAVKPNFHARYYKDEDAMNNKLYEELKNKHYIEQNKKIDTGNIKNERNNILYKLKKEHGWSTKDVAKISELSNPQINKIVATYTQITQNAVS